ncbi:hypothetical protein LTR37_018997 [Vermiconidia calcicola]|uniref:Uncharacterized protein n=1 Tax=Vermiconidia calcicola TaxID=1690605 RepID=A0ACC3MH80_9PEZI|nr:hypothetical protein LTR37_018997 [Vermiconidia calcicola]
MARCKRRRKDDDDTGEPRKAARNNQTKSAVTTRGAARRSLSDAAFLTTELVENVLSFLPMRDLLLDQRVCRKWANTITGSKQLQQALYFAPAKPQISWRYDHVECTLSRMSPAAPAKRGPKVHVYNSAHLNPLLFRSDEDPCGILIRAAVNGLEVFKFLRRPSTKYPEASWKKMLLAQPPLKSVEGTFDIKGQCEPWSGRPGRGAFARKIEEVEVVEWDGVRVWDVMKRIVAAETSVGRIKWSRQWMRTTGTLFPTNEELQMTDGELAALGQDSS